MAAGGGKTSVASNLVATAEVALNVVAGVDIAAAAQAAAAAEVAVVVVGVVF